MWSIDWFIDWLSVKTSYSRGKSKWDPKYKRRRGPVHQDIKSIFIFILCSEGSIITHFVFLLQLQNKSQSVETPVNDTDPGEKPHDKSMEPTAILNTMKEKIIREYPLPMISYNIYY